MPRILTGAFVLALLAACPWVLGAAVPHGWHLGGSNPADYLSGVDAAAMYQGHPSGYLKTSKTAANGYGLLMQEFPAAAYAGKRVRLSAFVKTDRVRDWAGLWMQYAEGPEPGVAVAKRQEPLINGATEWTSYEVVTDVPAGATTIEIGVMLHGPGTVWINSVSFAVTGPNEAKSPTPPANFDFEQ
jgi:hypothetical protein